MNTGPPPPVGPPTPRPPNPDVNVTTLFNASNMIEGMDHPYETFSLEGGVRRTPTLSDLMDKLERAKKELGPRYEGTVLASGAGGKRLYRVAQDQEEGVVDSQRLHYQGQAGVLTSEELANYIADSWKPGVTNIFHVRGHGHAHRDVVGMPTEEFVKGLHGAADKIGQKLDVVLLESCVMSSLDVLKTMQGCAHVVIASEEVLRATALPLEKLISTVADLHGTPRQVAEKLVETTRAEGNADTLVAVDLDKIHLLEDAYQELAGQLRTETEAGNDRQVRQALKSCDLFPRQWNDFSQKALRKELGLRDLGEIARAAKGSELPEPTAQAGARVEEALDEAILTRTTSEKYDEVSGISVNSSSLMPPSKGWNLLGWLGL